MKNHIRKIRLFEHLALPYYFYVTLLVSISVYLLSAKQEASLVNKLQDSKAIQTYYTCNDEFEYSFPVFFNSLSFCDPDVEAKSILDCHEELMNRYANKIKEKSDGDTVYINDSLLWDAIVSFKSIFFNPCLEYFALFIPNGGQPLWKPVKLQLNLKFIFEEYCDGPVAIMKLTPSQNDSLPEPILYAGLPNFSRNKIRREPNGYFPSKIIERVTDTINSTITTVFDVPADEPRIARVIRLDSSGIAEGTLLNLHSKLWVVLKTGDTLIIHEDKFFGHHSPINAFIGAPFFVDINGDGLFDIVFESSGSSQIIVLQLPYGGFEFRYLVNRDMSGTGGC